MGISVETACRTCKKMAPALADGEGGFLGELSLSTDPRSPAMGPQNLGYIYAAFEGVGAVTHDWHAFREFVAAHAGHDLATLSDDEAGLEHEGYDDPLKDEESEEVPEGWTYARLEALCQDCGVQYTTEHAEYLQPRAEFVVTRQAIEALEAVVPYLPDNLYRCEPFVEIAPLSGFLVDHREHQVVTRVIPYDE
jgi:hypothetical protein